MDYNSNYEGQEVQDILDSVAGKYVKPSTGIPASDLAPDVFLQGEKGEKGDKGDTGATGPQGPQGVGVTSVVQTTTSSADGGSNVVTVTLSNGTKSTFTVKNGSKGSQGEKGDKGDIGPQGNSGYQGVVGELEVVNNLTQGGEAAVLSAEQGKVLKGELTELSAETASLYYSDGRVAAGGDELESDTLSRTGYIPVKKGDVISSYIYRIYKFDKNLVYLAEDLQTSDGLLKIDYEITDESCAYVRLNCLRTKVSPIYLNGKSLVPSMIDSALGTSVIVGGEYPYKAFNIREVEGDAVAIAKKTLLYRDYINGAILGLWIKNPIEGATYYIPTFRYRQASADWNNTEYTQIVIAIKDANGATSYIQAVNDRTSATIKDGDIQTFDAADFLMIVDWSKAQVGSGSAMTPNDYLRLDDIVLKKNNTIYLATMGGDNTEIDLEKIYVREGITIPFKDKAYQSTSLDTPLIKGMVITDIGNAATGVVTLIGGNGTYAVTSAKLPYVIEDTITELYSSIPNSGEMRVEGILFGLEKSIDNVDAKVERESAYVRNGITIALNDKAYNSVYFDDTPLVKGMVITDIGNAVSVVVFGGGYNETITKAMLPFTVHTPITGVYANSANSGEMRVEGLLYGLENNLNALDAKVEAIQKDTRNKGNAYISMPIPQLAIVNIRATALPTTKTADIQAELDFNDLSGNVFTKNIIVNAQGNSSLGLAKKNFSIDFVDENYEESHEIKFGDWVAQDGFHLKSYMLDGIRVKPMAVYDFYESILLTRGVRKDRAWKRLQLPSNTPMASNDIADSYLQLDDGAKNHPSGFPIILLHNGEFYGIYCWQLKKHRANYHQKKNKAEHIHLDGNISNILLWEANGVLDWDKWAGKKQESDTSVNVDGIEVRNPKKLILTDGTEYDADTNTGELISANSAKYDSSNADMVRTAAVRANIESLSRRVYALTQMAKGAEKKSAIAEVFDVDSIIDYIIFGQITGNVDGYKKNWQWVTYDGIKWAVNAYDLDGTWGWTSWSYYAPYTTWIGNSTPPVTLIIENYLDEIKARYKELRDKGVIDLAKIMQPLVNYVKVIGIDYYDMEFEKWTDGARDNLWRFESWMEESIKRTDALMGYNS